MEKSCRKCTPKAFTRHLFNSGKWLKAAIACKKVFQKMQYFERELSKGLKKVNFIFLSNPISFNGQDYKKLNGHETSDQSLFRLQKSSEKTLY